MDHSQQITTDRGLWEQQTSRIWKFAVIGQIMCFVLFVSEKYKHISILFWRQTQRWALAFIIYSGHKHRDGPWLSSFILDTNTGMGLGSHHLFWTQTQGWALAVIIYSGHKHRDGTWLSSFILDTNTGVGLGFHHLFWTQTQGWALAFIIYFTLCIHFNIHLHMYIF